MILDAKSGVRGVLVNRETGQIIRHVRWADIPENPEEMGEFEAFRVNPIFARERGIPLQSILYRGRCRLRFEPARTVDPKPAGRIAPSTPFAEIKREVLKGGEVKATPIVYVPGAPLIECHERYCHRPARWSVATERLVEPERGEDGKLWERAVVVDVLCWCDAHFKNPLQISERGVESEIEVTRARPE